MDFCKGGFFMEIKLSSIKKIESMAKLIPGVISLAQGIPSFASHGLIRKRVIEAITDGLVDKYSEAAGLMELRTAFSNSLMRKKNIFYDPRSEIIVTAGAIEALSATVLTFFDRGDEIVILTPCYPYYEKIIQMSKAKVVSVKLNEQKGWKLNIDEFKKKINSKTKAIIICSPNNPTGSVLSKKDLNTISILAQRRKILIIEDSIYENVYFDQEELPNLYSQEQFRKNVLRIVSLSKDFSLSGWRIGFIHGDEKRISKILPVHDNLVNCPPVVSQYAALAALENEEGIISGYLKSYRQRRDLMATLLESCRPYLDFVLPKGACYFFPKVIGVNNTEQLCLDILEKSKVAVVPGDDFGLGGKGHIRLCYGKSEEEIKEGMKRLIRYFKNIF
jgi:aminotransferase